MTRILHIGLPLDHSSIPAADRPALRRRLDTLQAEMREAGYDYDIVHHSPEQSLDGFRAQLCKCRYDGVLVGGGVASNPDMADFLRAIADVTRDAAPQARLMLHDHAVDVLTTVKRSLGPAGAAPERAVSGSGRT